MTEFVEKYINPFTDYGFKKLFGEEPNKDLLLDFLNEFLKEEETRFDKWLFVLRNLNRLDRVPEKLKEKVFDKLFETAEIAKFTPDQVRSYEDSLKYYRDLKNSLDTARNEGEYKKAIDVAKKLLESNVDIDIIIKSTGLSKQEIETLKIN